MNSFDEPLFTVRFPHVVPTSPLIARVDTLDDKLKKTKQKKKKLVLCSDQRQNSRNVAKRHTLAEPPLRYDAPLPLQSSNPGVYLSTGETDIEDYRGRRYSFGQQAGFICHW